MVTRFAESPYTCGWSTDLCAGKLEDAFSSDDADRVALAQRCLDAAAEVLYALSGRQFGLCEWTVRPCYEPCESGCVVPGGHGYPWTPYLGSDGEWRNARCGGDNCCSVCEVRLPGPVDSITQVRIDGEVLPATAYRVDNRNQLVALRRPIPEDGRLILGYAFLDQSAQVCVDRPAVLLLGTDLGGGCYGPDDQGRLQLAFEDLPAAGVTADYTGPAQGISVLTYPSTDPNTAGEAFLFAPFAAWAVGETQTSTGIEDFGQPGNEASGATRTLLSGMAPTFNAPRNLAIQGDHSIRYAATRVDEFCWPTCQDMTAAPDQPGTWEVTYLRGLPVPELGRAALAELAGELCLSCLGDSCCALPRRVTSIVREGVTMAMLDPMDFIDKGKTGLYLVDLWLTAVNPHKRVRAAGILSPDYRPVRRTTWPV